MATRIPAPGDAAAVHALGVESHGDVAGRVQVPIGFRRREHRRRHEVAGHFDGHAFEDLLEGGLFRAYETEKLRARIVDVLRDVVLAEAFHGRQVADDEACAERALIHFARACDVDGEGAHLQNVESRPQQHVDRNRVPRLLGREIRDGLGIDLMLRLEHRDAAHRSRRGLRVDDVRHRRRGCFCFRSGLLFRRGRLLPIRHERFLQVCRQV
ncbi:MAG TPA: hypothetical protein VGQ46_13135 [Thermoanaerobaculia bacterium]|nr:hypothetical protein [Thermoanaerobaculia bacterium]